MTGALDALYIDADSKGGAYRDRAHAYFEAAGYVWLPPFLGARGNIAASQFTRALARCAEAAHTVVLRFIDAPLEDQWAYAAPSLELFGRVRRLAVLDASGFARKPALDARLGHPAFLIDGPAGFISTLRAAIPPASC